MEIRRLTERDAAEIRDARIEALRDNPEPFVITLGEEADRTVEDVAARFRATEGSSSTATLGAFEGGRLVGLVGFYRLLPTKVRHRAVVWGMYVRAAARNRGVGGALVRAALAELQAMPGVEQAEINVLASEASTRRVCLAAGFELEGIQRRTMKVGEHYVDEARMVLRWA